MLTSYQPPAKPPFHAAIMESGQYSLRADVPDYTASWTSLAAAVNCATASDTLACMRALPATTLKDALEHLALTFSFVPDNVTYVGNAAEPNRLRGEIANVPTLAGSNADEGIIFTLAYNNTRAYLMNLFANNTALVDRVIAAYPLGEDGIETETQQIAAIYTDYGFQCTCAVVANDTKTGGIPSYRYVCLLVIVLSVVLTMTGTSTTPPSLTLSSSLVLESITQQRSSPFSAHILVKAQRRSRSRYRTSCRRLGLDSRRSHTLDQVGGRFQL